MAVEIKNINKHEIEEEECRGNRKHSSHEMPCVCKVVRDIFQKQKEAIIEDSCLNCQGRIGENIINTHTFANTRPFILYLRNGYEFSFRIAELCNNHGSSTKQPPTNDYTSYFRVEEVRGYCALLRGLKCCTPPDSPRHPTQTLQCTPFCCWVDLNEFIAIQCFSDTYINIPSPIEDTFPPDPPAMG